MSSLTITETLIIPAEQLEVAFARSSGPGGQNVNKVESKVRLRFDFERCEGLTEDAKARLRARYLSRLDAEGWLVVVSQQTRDQRKNLDAARERLTELVRAILVPPTPRKKTRPGRAAKARRLNNKRHVAEKKALRRLAPHE